MATWIVGGSAIFIGVVELLLGCKCGPAVGGSAGNAVDPKAAGDAATSSNVEAGVSASDVQPTINVNVNLGGSGADAPNFRVNLKPSDVASAARCAGAVAAASGGGSSSAAPANPFCS